MELLDRSQLLQQAVVRLIAATPNLTYFGPDAVSTAIADAIAAGAANLQADLKEAYRRTFLKASSGAYLDDLAEEASRERGKLLRAHVYTVFVPETSVVTSIVDLAPPFVISVTGYSGWQVGDVFTIQGSTEYEYRTVAGIGAGTVETPILTHFASYVADIAAGRTVMVLFQATVPQDSLVNYQGGVVFQTLAAVTTGTANPIMAGEGTDLSLLDKAWCECTTGGARGNVARMTALGLVTPIRGVKRVFNPLPATGGQDSQDDFAVKYAVAHAPEALVKTPIKALEALSAQFNPRCLRLSLNSTSLLSTISLAALSTSLGALTADEKSDLALFLAGMSSPGMTFLFTNITLTSVEVSAIVTFASGPAGETAAARQARFRAMWARIASALAGYLDLRYWVEGADVPESDLLKRVTEDAEIANVDLPTFLPANDVVVTVFPKLGRLVLTDTQTGYAYGDDLAQVY